MGIIQQTKESRAHTNWLAFLAKIGWAMTKNGQISANEWLTSLRLGITQPPAFSRALRLPHCLWRRFGEGLCFLWRETIMGQR